MRMDKHRTKSSRSRKRHSEKTMSRRRFTQAMGLAGGALLAGNCSKTDFQTQAGRTATRPRRTPNLLFIWTDEQRRDSLACYGNHWIRTPHLNRLAQDSFVFDRCYVTQTVCTPSRGSVVTGLYPHTHGCIYNNVPLQTETQTIAEMVSSEYHCGYIGKWHLGDEVIAQHGFTHWQSIEDQYRHHYSEPEYLHHFSDYYHFLRNQGLEPDNTVKDGAEIFSRWFAASLREEWTKAAFCGKEAAKFIRDNKNQPFLLHVNMLEPHMPFTGPLNNLYPPDSLPSREHYLKPPPENASWRNRLKAKWFQEADSFANSPIRTEQDWRRVCANYYGLVSMVDNAVGEILDAVEKNGLLDNTIIVFTSDHGDQMGDHFMMGKSVMYEESLSVPCLVRVPWMQDASHHIPGAFGQVDLVPTLLELMNQPLPDHLEGQSRVREMQDQSGLVDNSVFAEWNDNGRSRLPEDTPEEALNKVQNQPWRTVIHQGWKLNLSPVDQCELYNLNADPLEQNNLIENPAFQGRLHDMTEQLRDWQAKTGDTAWKI